MGRAILSILFLALIGTSVRAQIGPGRFFEPAPIEVPGVSSEQAPAESLLAAGSRAIRLARYDDGIRLTLLGLEKDTVSAADRAAGFANVCAAHAAKGELELAVRFCERATEANRQEWRAFSNLAWIYWQMGLVPEALIAIDSARAINPNAEQVERMRRMILEPGAQ